MKTRLMLCLLALVALLAASCGSDTSDDSAEVSSDDTATAEPTAEPTADSGDQAETDEDGENATTNDGDTADDADSTDTGDGNTEDGDTDETATAEPTAGPTEAADPGGDEADGDAPQRIISLNPTATEMLFAIGAGDQVIAVDEFSYYPTEAPVTDLSGYDPNIEAIAGYEPDLVVSDLPIEGLDAIDVPNVTVPAAVTLDDIYAQIEQLGALTGHVGEAAELVLQMQTDIDAALASVDTTSDTDAPALTYYHELDNTLYSVTSTTFIGYVYGLFGLENIADPADADGAAFGYPQLNEEFILTADPDLIFLADTLCCEQSAATVAERPGWDQLRSVQNGHVVELNDDVVSRWGPRIVDFIEAVAAAVSEIQTADATQ